VVLKASSEESDAWPRGASGNYGEGLMERAAATSPFCLASQGQANGGLDGFVNGKDAGGI
jgi:hypothetical protein